ncbi:MAG TPA: SDR family oxidoreductase [Conexibacter sp.]
MRVLVTGASGWIGAAVVPELIGAGHHVIGLARSEDSAAALETAGADVVRGSLDDLDVLRAGAAAADGVIHLAFKHDIAFSGDYDGAAVADRRAIDAFGEALAGTDRPFVIASGLAGIAVGRVATEHDQPDLGTPGPASARGLNTQAALAFAARGVRASAVRLAPTVHGDGDNGFIAMQVAIARDRGVSAYVGDGANRWPAVHRLDAARLFRLGLEQAPAGAVLHGAADEGISAREIAAAIGRQLDLPVASIAPEEAAGHFGWLGGFFSLDMPATSTLTRERLGWEPTHPGLIEDLEQGHYFREVVC